MPYQTRQFDHSAQLAAYRRRVLAGKEAISAEASERDAAQEAQLARSRAGVQRRAALAAIGGNTPENAAYLNSVRARIAEVGIGKFMAEEAEIRQNRGNVLFQPAPGH